MTEKTIKVTVFRYDPTEAKEPGFKEYSVPFEKGMSAMDALDYIYQTIDSTLAYYDHAGCSLGICARCTGKVNGRPGLLCQMEITGDAVIEPVNASKALRDMVMQRSAKGA